MYLAVGRVGSASKDVKQCIEYVEESRKVEKLVEHLMPLQNELALGESHPPVPLALASLSPCHPLPPSSCLSFRGKEEDL